MERFQHNGPAGFTFRIALLVSSKKRDEQLNELESIAIDKISRDDLKAWAVVELSGGVRAHVEIHSDPSGFISSVRTAPFDSLLIDNREELDPPGFSDTVAGRALPELLANPSFGRLPNRGSILIILSDGPSTAHHAYAVGSLQLGGVLVAPKTLANELDFACKASRPAEPGKVALCLAGGGIEGMFYELGVLRALDAHLRGKSVIDFDIFSGISAGAVLGAFAANRVRPAELARSLKGLPSRIGRIKRSMLFDPNLGEMANRAVGAAGDALRGQWFRRPIDSLLKAAPNSIFSGDKLRSYLEKELAKPGLTDDFSRLEKELYIGATDQDTGAHVVFGDEGMKDVPISRALRASMAMTPYYPPEQIKERYYIDGIFTRTVDVDVAVAHGARLLICIDPLTPVMTAQAGYVSSKGGIFNTVQSIKALIRTRFSEVIGRAEEAYPDVVVYLFSPTSKDLEQMSGTLMRFFYKIETEEMAFESASNKIVEDFEWLARDLARHGFELSRDPAI